MSEPQFRMVVVRLLEGAVVLLLAMAALELWSGYQFAAQGPDPSTGALRPEDFSWSRLAETLVFYTFRGPISLLVASLLLVGTAAALAVRGPVANAKVLRWEAAALASVTAVATLSHLVVGLVALMTLERGLGEAVDSRFMLGASLGWPLVGLVLLAVFFLWWLRLADDEDGSEDDAVARVGRTPHGDETQDLTPRDEGAETDGFRGAEPIAPAERPPRGEGLSPDGSTTNGYDEYFRRG